MDKIEANWWQENVPAAIWQRAKYAAQMHRSSGGPEGYVPEPNNVDPSIRHMPELWMDAENDDQLNLINEYWARQISYKEMHSQGGALNFGAAAGSAMADPFSWCGPAASGRLAGGFLKSAAVSAGGNLPVLAAQEAVLGALQPTRTKEEMVFAVGVGTLLSGGIGGVVGLASKRALRNIDANINHLIGRSDLQIHFDPKTQKYYEWTDEAREQLQSTQER